MSAQGPQPIPFPTSTSPGNSPQEGAGRLINCYAEPLGDGGPAKIKWIRSAGLSLFASTAQSGYRGGLLVNNLSFEAWSGNASTIDATGTVISLGVLPGTKKVSIARNQASPVPDVVAVDVDNGAYVLESATVANATATATVAGTSFVAGDIVNLVILNDLIDDFPITISYTVVGGDTATTIATALKTKTNANTVLIANKFTATSSGAVITIVHTGAIGNSTSMTYAATGAVVGNWVASTAYSTIGELVSNGGNYYKLVTAGTSATSGGPSGTGTGNIKDGGAVWVYSAEASGGETITFSPASGNLAGGSGTYGAFTGAPTAYTGQSNLPQPNSVCFQDGYFFFSTAANFIYASPLNGLTMNALTFVMAEAKSDVTLLRVIAFSGFLLAFTTGSLEVWQDAANPAPAFPYSRIAVLEFSLAQAIAIAGWETGFSELLWVGQDNGVYWMTVGQLAAQKVSPPDLDRLIETEIKAGNTLEASCYVAQGKKFWVLSSPNWTWEFNLKTLRWNERWSLASTGIFGRWRATGSHPAFGKWLTGDTLSGNILYLDDTNASEVGAVQLWRMESGPVQNFPEQIRVARGDFNFVIGVGRTVGSRKMTVTGAALGTNGVVRLVVDSTSQVATGDVGTVSGVTGTTEANGNWTLTIVDTTHVELQSSVFANAYVSGGSVVDLTVPNNVVNPTVAISNSKDGGQTYGNPLIRKLGQQQNTKNSRVSVTNMGLSSSQGDRWRLDITDPVYASFMGGTQSSDIRVVGG
jgi:hypothetical protein